MKVGLGVKLALVPYRRGAAIAALGSVARTVYQNRDALQAGATRARELIDMVGRTRSGRSFRGNPRQKRQRTVRGPVKKFVRSTPGVTQQHDVRNVYRKRRMPRRRRRAWKRFSRKVNAVSEKTLGSNTVVFNLPAGYTQTNTTAGAHGVYSFALYGNSSGTRAHMNDLRAISLLPNFGDQTAAAGESTFDTTKFIFKSGVLDITMVNTSTVNVLVDSVLTAVPDASMKLEVDVYELISSRKWLDSTMAASTVEEMLNRGGALTTQIGGAGAGFDNAARGVTPWDLPTALSYFRVKILKKTKYFLENRGILTYQIRDPKRHVFNQESMERWNNVNRPGVTRFVYIIFKKVPGTLPLGTLINQSAESMTFGITRKYLYKVEGVTEDRDNLVAA